VILTTLYLAGAKNTDNAKMQGAKKERPPMKKEANPNCKGLKKKDLR
jgi:hypothetical protein